MSEISTLAVMAMGIGFGVGLSIRSGREFTFATAGRSLLGLLRSAWRRSRPEPSRLTATLCDPALPGVILRAEAEIVEDRAEIVARVAGPCGIGLAHYHLDMHEVDAEVARRRASEREMREGRELRRRLAEASPPLNEIEDPPQVRTRR